MIRTAMVRMAVPRFDSMPVMPIFPRMAVRLVPESAMNI
jgi:hypothetical protein